MKPKTPGQAAADYERQEKARERMTKRVAKGLSAFPECETGEHHRKYQTALEERGQLRIPGA